MIGFFFSCALVLTASLAAPVPAEGQDISIQPGQTLKGVMPAGDPEGTRVFYIISPAQTGPVTIEARSLDFDTGLSAFAMSADGAFVHVASDDDGRLGTDSRLVLDAEVGGRYRIELHAVVEDWGGEFEISVQTGAQKPLDAEVRMEADWTYWTQVRQRAKEAGKLGREIRALVGLGWVLKDKGSLPQARELFSEAVSLSEKGFGPEDPVTAMGLNALGRLLWDMGSLSEARRIYERALAIREKALGPDHTEVAWSLTVLANLLSELDSTTNEQARKLLERALAIREKHFGPDHPEVADSLEALTWILTEMGAYAEARPLAERAVRIREAYFGPEHAAVSPALRMLSIVQLELGELAGARANAERALAIQEKAFGPDHPEISNSLAYLAVILGTMGYAEESGRLHERVLRITEKYFGEEAIARDLHNVASSLHVLGSYVEARAMFERALALEEKEGPENPVVVITMTSLGRLLVDIGAFDEARPILERARDLRLASLGPDHPDNALSLNALVLLHEKRGSYAEALPLARQALALREKQLGPDHPSTAASLGSLSKVLWLMGSYAEARPLAERALKIQEARLGPESNAVAGSLTNLVRLLRDSGSASEALPLAERAATILEKQLGGDHPRVAEARQELALVEAALGDTRKAVADALRAEQVGREHLRLMVRSLPERQALRYSSVRTSGLTLALALVSGGSSEDTAAAEVWDALIRSRSLVVDEMGSRHRTVAEASQIARLAERLASASTRLANLMVGGAGERPADQYRLLLDDARKEREEAERALAMRSGAFSDQMERDRLGLKDVLSRLPAGTALVGYSLYARPEGLRPAGAAGRGPAAPAAERSYLAFVARSAGDPIVAVPLGAAGEIEALISDWRREAQAPMQGGKDDALLAAYRRSGAELRRKIWDPIAPHLGAARRVLLVPDGALNLVAFAALPAGEAGYLIEETLVMHYLSAERDVALLARDQPRGEGLLAMGEPAFDETSFFASLASSGDSRTVRVAMAPVEVKQISYRGDRASCDPFESIRFTPLPGTGPETLELAGLWERAGLSAASATRLTGASASEASFKSEAPGRRVLHLATHGFFLGGECRSALSSTRGIGSISPAGENPTPPEVQGENPLRLAGLVLAGANHRAKAGPEEEDGVLTAEEISAMDLSGVEWAVLSACDTGLGEIEAGEGVFGLRRAFRVAGARTLIMSLWPVEDEATRQWMMKLYEGRLLARRETSDTVRSASLDLLASRRASGQSVHPFYWAAFVAAGDWR